MCLGGCCFGLDCCFLLEFRGMMYYLFFVGWFVCLRVEGFFIMSIWKLFWIIFLDNIIFSNEDIYYGNKLMVRWVNLGGVW